LMALSTTAVTGPLLRLFTKERQKAVVEHH
jgi:hypothetical protein